MKNFKQIIEHKLLQLPHSKRINPQQIALRCKLCGDSKKDPNKTRFYVQIKEDTPILYNCFNCGASGILTPSILRSFNINDLELNTNLMQYNKTSVKTINKKFGLLKSDKFNYKVPFGRKKSIDEIKKRYIETRLNIKLSFEELKELKTVFSLEQFLLYNDIKTLTVDTEKANLLNNDYIGFLSMKNDMIVFRDITSKHKYRYLKYDIFNNLDNAKKFYTIPNKIDIMTNDIIEINLAEGIFDILGVYYHIKKKDLKNKVYAAICGSAYTSVLKYFISLGIFGSNVIVNIYSDSDKDYYWYKNMIKELKPYVKTINLFYNKKEKDFGVPLNRISLKRYE